MAHHNTAPRHERLTVEDLINPVKNPDTSFIITDGRGDTAMATTWISPEGEQDIAAQSIHTVTDVDGNRMYHFENGSRLHVGTVEPGGQSRADYIPADPRVRVEPLEEL